MRKRAFFLCLSFLLQVGAASAVDVYRFPEIKPRLTLESGYRFVGLEGSKRAGEYEFLEGSVPLGVNIVAFPFPHRLYLELEAAARKDYFLDLRYAYRDIVLSRWLNRTLFHNLENVQLLSTGTDIRDAGAKYGVRSAIDDLSLRLKAPYYPLHVYAEAHVLKREGSIQQKFLGGSGYFNNQVRASDERDINWRTQALTIGANSHIGPVELDYSHQERTFDSGDSGVLAESFTAAAEPWPPFGAIRAAGTFPHNLVPDLRSSTDTLKLHTSYTGRVVGSVTLSKTESENEDSGAEAKRLSGSAEVRWSPFSRLKMSFRFRHREADADNPDSLPALYLGMPSPAVTGIRPSLSSETDTVSGMMKYAFDIKRKLFRDLSLTVDYSHSATERENAELWDVPRETADDALVLTAEARLPKGMKLKLRYKHMQTEHPVYNLPDTSNSGQASLKWTPVKSLAAFVSYGLSVEQRNKVELEAAQTERETTRSRFAGNLTFIIRNDLTLTTGYSYIGNRKEQGLQYNEFDPATFERDVLYKDTAHNYLASVNYAPKDKINLSAEVVRTVSEGDFMPVMVESPSKVDLEETSYALSGRHELKGGWGLGARYKHIDLESSSASVQSGDVDITLLHLSKKF